MKQIISYKNFPYKHLTTTKIVGNMKDKVLRDKFLLSLNLDPSNLILANQMHGNNVKAVNSFNKNTFIAECDGLITADKNTMLGIFTADCVPLLMSIGNGEVKAAIHTGWKGIYLGIIENAVKIFHKDFSIKPEDIKAYIGPHIRSCCYDVDCDMEDKFNVELVNNKLDLSEIVCRELQKLGINEIFDVKHCTFHEEDLFFSHRRNQCAERMLSVIM
jgi:YfiH family protein